MPVIEECDHFAENAIQFQVTCVFSDPRFVFLINTVPTDPFDLKRRIVFVESFPEYPEIVLRIFVEFGSGCT
ncbi:hypothetical protein D3C86_1723420 [compost metagenome]